jgi:hypothetical protein
MDDSRVMPATAKVILPSQLSTPSLPETTGKATKPGNAVAGEGRTNESASGSTIPSLGELLSAIPGEPPAISAGREVWPTRWMLSIPIYLLIVFLLLVANVVLTTRPGVVTCDSQPFADAMEDVWYPLVLAKQNTPRAAKRFVNRVRYLAIRSVCGNLTRLKAGSPFQSLCSLQWPPWSKWNRHGSMIRKFSTT